MSARTPIYGIEYPVGADLVKDLPSQLQAAAQTTEAALHQVDQRATPAGSTPVIAQTFQQLNSMGGVTGQSGYVTDDTSGRGGLYLYDGSSWTRGAQIVTDAFELANNNNWTTTGYAWTIMGVPYLYLRVTRKHSATWQPGAVLATEKVAQILRQDWYPPFYAHLPAFTSNSVNENGSEIGIQMQGNGSIMLETLTKTAGVKTTGTIQAMLTWPTVAMFS